MIEGGTHHMVCLFHKQFLVWNELLNSPSRLDCHTPTIIVKISACRLVYVPKVINQFLCGMVVPIQQVCRGRSDLLSSPSQSERMTWS